MTIGHSRSIHLGLLFHNHQPVGNFPWVFQQVYEESYLPMIDALERHPTVYVTLHYTGSLLDWFAEAQPGFLKRIAALVKRGQVDVAGGGYYEPILPAIPDQDKVGQIRRLSERIEQEFGTKPTGMWLAERVWEPGLPRLLTEAGMEWTILDDIHFKNVGLEDADLYGYYATEDQSSVLKVYATSKALRYTIPWRPATETIETLRSLATPDGKRIIVMGDDGEKFGSWPETNAYCWGNMGQAGWIEAFFCALEENSEWLHMTLLGDHAHNQHALGRIYLPTSSYLEMTEWALPPQKAYQFSKLLHQLEKDKQENSLQFMRGGFWRNFLVRYPEVNNQHKKMLRVHDNVYKAGASEEVGLVHLWKAQANDTYWHGLFGGIYMTHVRSAIYHHLIKAENAADRAKYGAEAWQHYEFSDFDRDTQDELLIEGDQQNVYISPQHGGSIFEWDLRRSAHNMSSVMTRRAESYHQTLRDYETERRHNAGKETQTEGELASPHTTIRTKEADLDQHLVVDRYNRHSLIDHFLPQGLPLTNFAQLRYEEQGNFVDQPYEISIEQDTSEIAVKMLRNGQVKRTGALGPLPVSITKILHIPLCEEKLAISYTVENKGQSRLQTLFACEWNMNLLGGGANPQAYCITDRTAEKENVHFDATSATEEVATVRIGNTWLQQEVAFTFSQDATLWRFSIDTVTGSEAGFERTHQGSCLTFVWPLSLEPGTNWKVEIVARGCKPG